LFIQDFNLFKFGLDRVHYIWYVMTGLYRFIMQIRTKIWHPNDINLYKPVKIWHPNDINLYKPVKIWHPNDINLYKPIKIWHPNDINLYKPVKIWHPNDNLSDNDSHTVREITFFFFFSTYTTYDMTPSAHMSVENDTGSKLIISGAQNSAVPNSTLTVFPSSNF
jgi:hypothetical protein